MSDIIGWIVIVAFFGSIAFGIISMIYDAGHEAGMAYERDRQAQWWLARGRKS